MEQPQHSSTNKCTVEEEIVNKIANLGIVYQENMQSRSVFRHFDIESGVHTYHRALEVYRKKQNPIGSSKDQTSWLYRVPYYKKLSEVKDCNSQDVLLQRSKQVDEYLEELSSKFHAINRRSTSELEAKIAVVKTKWEAKHGALPVKTTTLNKQLQESANAPFITNTASSNSSGSSELNSDDTSSCYTPSIPAMSPPEVLRSMIASRKHYHKSVTEITSKHGPKVHALPGTPAWRVIADYFSIINSRNAILLSLDIEAFEYDTNVVTEIGFAIYDPRENQGTLIPEIRSYHLCPTESLKVVNQSFVPNTKDKYLMGDTLVMPLENCIEFIQGLLDYYLLPVNGKADSYYRAIVGHNVQTDLVWLKKMQIKVPEISSAKVDKLHFQPHSEVRILDTSNFWGHLYGNKGGSLGKVLRAHNIPHSNLHNAGNDAYYTLQLLLKMGDIQLRRQNDWDNLYAMHEKFLEWDQWDKEMATYPDGSTNRQTKPGSGGRNSRSSRKLRNWRTELGGMRYYTTLDHFVNSFNQ